MKKQKQEGDMLTSEIIVVIKRKSLKHLQQILGWKLSVQAAYNTKAYNTENPPPN